MAVAEARKYVSNMGYDPYRIKDYSQSFGITTVSSTHTWVTGLASFYRMGNITLVLENGKVKYFDHPTVMTELQQVFQKSFFLFFNIFSFLNRETNFALT